MLSAKHWIGSWDLMGNLHSRKRQLPNQLGLDINTTCHSLMPAPLKHDGKRLDPLTFDDLFPSKSSVTPSRPLSFFFEISFLSARFLESFCFYTKLYSFHSSLIFSRLFLSGFLLIFLVLAFSTCTFCIFFLEALWCTLPHFGICQCSSILLKGVS